MTLGAFVVCTALSIIIILIGIFIGYGLGTTSSGAIIGGLIGFILSCLMFAGVFWYYSSTASGARALKSQESNFNKGIERKVEVYSMDGKLLRTYEGKFDLEYDDDRILFDDENGDRHIIYYQTGTVFIDEVSD